MERLDFFICSVVAFFGLAAAVLGFVAEAVRIPAHAKAQLIGDGKTCLYPKTAAKFYGTGSLLALLVAQVIVNVAACWICRGTQYRSNWKKALVIICSLFSWIAFLFAIGLLMNGIIWSAERKTSTTFSNGKCLFKRPAKDFLGGGFLALASITFGIFYYILTSRIKKLEKQMQNQNIAMTYI